MNSFVLYLVLLMNAFKLQAVFLLFPIFIFTIFELSLFEFALETLFFSFLSKRKIFILKNRYRKKWTFKLHVKVFMCHNEMMQNNSMVKHSSFIKTILIVEMKKKSNNHHQKIIIIIIFSIDFTGK